MAECGRPHPKSSSTHLWARFFFFSFIPEFIHSFTHWFSISLIPPFIQKHVTHTVCVNRRRRSCHRRHRVHTRILSVCYASGTGVGTQFYKAKSPTRGAHTLVRETANKQTVRTHGDAPGRHGREQYRAVSGEYEPERPNSHHSLWQRALQCPTLSAHVCSLHTWELPGSSEELLTRMERRGS